MRDRLTTTRENGIFRKTDGTFVVRCAKKDPRTGKRSDTTRTIVRDEGMSAADYWERALAIKIELLSDIADTGRGAGSPSVAFRDYAEKVIKGRIDSGRIGSRATELRYEHELEKHIYPKWGSFHLDKIYREDVREWMGELGKKVKAGDYAPETVNGFWRTFKTIMTDAAVDFRLANPCERIQAIDTSLRETYTVDEPNSLEPKELKRFFEQARIMAPKYFGFLTLGVLTGRRPCELRPLRADDDLNWDTGRLLVRRSQTFGAPNDRLKQKRHVLAWLSTSPLGILKWHRDHLSDYQARSGLLFPPVQLNHFTTERKLEIVALAERTTIANAHHESGVSYKSIQQWMNGEALDPRSDVAPAGFMGRSTLRNVLPAICEKAKIKKHITPRFMRRTYQDLCREAGVSDFVQKAMSGHATDKMKDHYSTAGKDEGQRALASMCAVAGLA